jgi:hypothetical protein
MTTKALRKIAAALLAKAGKGDVPAQSMRLRIGLTARLRRRWRETLLVRGQKGDGLRCPRGV